MWADVVSDCPECRGVTTVFFGVCSVCFAEFDELRRDEREPVLEGERASA